MYLDISIPIQINPSSQAWMNSNGIFDHSIFVNQHVVFGTHIDVPTESAAKVEFDNLMGECLVVRIPDSAKKIELGHLLKLPLVPGGRVIFKTKNSSGWSKPGHPPTPMGIDVRAGQWLADRHLKLVGVDGWSVDKPEDEDSPIHNLLLGSGAYLLESLYLDHIAPGSYELFALPLMLSDSSLAPCRAVLRKVVRM